MATNEACGNVIISHIEAIKSDARHVVTEESRLLEDAGVDSLALMELIEEIQRKCEVSFLPEDYSPENFATAGDLIRLVAARKANR